MFRKKTLVTHVIQGSLNILFFQKKFTHNPTLFIYRKPGCAVAFELTLKKTPQNDSDIYEIAKSLSNMDDQNHCRVALALFEDLLATRQKSSVLERSLLTKQIKKMGLKINLFTQTKSINQEIDLKSRQKKNILLSSEQLRVQITNQQTKAHENKKTRQGRAKSIPESSFLPILKCHLRFARNKTAQKREELKTVTADLKSNVLEHEKISQELKNLYMAKNSLRLWETNLRSARWVEKNDEYKPVNEIVKITSATRQALKT